MNVAAKLLSFLVVLAAVFGVAFLTGTQSAALLAPPPTHDNRLGGLSAGVDGYVLAAVTSELEPGADRSVAFRLTGPDGRPVTELTEINGEPMHLIALRRDLTGFQHVTPVPGNGASLRAELDLTPGPWRIAVELFPRTLGRPITLGVDLLVRGDYRAEAPPPTTETVRVDGLDVRRIGPLTTRPEDRVAFTITEGAEPVSDLQPMHAAPGHAVVVRPGDLGLAHLHAEADGGRGPRLEFVGSVPEPGTYAVFVEFRRAGRLHVAAYTVPVPG